MPELHGTDDVFRSLVEESEDSWLMGLVAFAVVEDHRIEWKNHFLALHGNKPTAEDIERWYLEQLEGFLLRAKADAENYLAAYTEEIRNQTIKEERQQIERDLVVSEIRLTRRFWPQFGVGVAAGTVSAFLFAMILVSFALLISADISPIKLMKDAV
jgi:hypothetical protein